MGRNLERSTPPLAAPVTERANGRRSDAKVTHGRRRRREEGERSGGGRAHAANAAAALSDE